ncbi:RHS repeat-associated core domain-containing protein [Pseudomonas guariconensis]|uniref:RHS repeat-associated core domain-containing protein n=1 Tax=Pseudomonas guariconensis TaxID=1288410 RepID=UPI0018A9C0C0|nr:RHS repeat-associated core domain-containing protein [Pseudomonas guariconensis]MBF8720933.1 RHS domain-containing protein [Pseudomonas guariconensis]MBF8791243.1 RHS domain-containing protein [Pseudomonas monteilii]
MSDALWAAREGDALMHTSMLADIVGGVLEVAANVAIGALATAAVAAALGITVVTGGLGCFVLGAVVGLVVGVVMAKTGADTGLSRLCEGIGNALFPPTVQANIATGSKDTRTNGKPSARAAGVVLAPPAPMEGGAEGTPTEEPEETFLDMAKGFFSQMWRPTVATPAPNTAPADDDKVICSKHPPMPPQFLAEGSSKVMINGHPACRSGDRSTCDAVIVDAGLISDNVRIGGEPIVVREIRSGKTPGIGLAITALMMLRGRGGKFTSKFGCMLLGGITNLVTAQVTSALTSALVGSPNPVHTPTGAKILNGPEDLDFDIPALIPLHWQRYYNSHSERRDGLLGQGWSVEYEVYIDIQTHPEGGERLLFIDEQARCIDMGNIPPGEAAYSAGEGLSVRRDRNGEVLIEDRDGRYRLFQPTPESPERLRLGQVGDRNDNRVYLDYDDLGRLHGLRDTFGLVDLELHYSARWPTRLAHVERRYADGSSERLVSYGYDDAGSLAEVRAANDQTTRHFVYDAERHMVEHRLPTGLRCFYEWTRSEDGWRVARYWSDAGDEYRFDYDIAAGQTRVTDGLGRVSTRRWNSQYQVTRFTDALGLTWHFDWNDERQLLNATDPADGQWHFDYDESGNLMQVRDPLGRSESTQWLEHWALPRQRTDRAGNTWHYRYDQRGNCICRTDPLGHSTHIRYDGQGRATEITDANGKTRQLRWNDLGRLTMLIDCSGYPSRLEYDHRGHLVCSIDALGERTEYRRDIQGRLLEVVYPDGRREQLEYDGAGLLLRHTDPGGHSQRYQYDRRGLLLRHVDALGRAVEHRYDPYGRLLVLLNENGEHYRFDWDAGDRLVQRHDLDGSSRRYQYDALDGLLQLDQLPAPHGDGLALVPEHPPAAISHRYERDAGGRLLAKITSDGRTDYRYDKRDLLLQACFTDAQGNRDPLTFTYDALGRIVTESSSAGTLQHEYDELGNRLRTVLPDGRVLNQLYYGSGHLHQINLDGTLISDFERDRLHREVHRTQGTLETRSEYDRNGRLRARSSRVRGAAIHMPAPVQQRFEYDLQDSLQSRLDQMPGTQLQQWLLHDATQRVVACQSSDGNDERFAYDPAGNLLDGMSGGLVRHNRVLTYQDKRYRYDAFGRLVEKRSARRGVQQLRYDAEQRLVEVRSRQGGHERVVRMRYDPLGRRVEKSQYDAYGRLLMQTLFSWDGYRLLGEQRHGLESVYLYMGDSFEPLARIDGNGAHQQVRYFHNDLSGLPARLTASTGEVIWKARYQVWGNTVEEVREAPMVEEQNLRFQGQYLDRETGLHYNLFRYFDPDIGRFTQPDPIGLAGGLNLYRYAPNPATWIDPHGLAVCRLSKEDRDNMGPKPAGMVNPHRHHVVRESAPGNWKPENRAYILGAQKIMKDFGIDINTDPRNFTWARNGGRTHTVAAAKEVFTRLNEVKHLGLKEVERVLAELRQEFTQELVGR